MTTTTFYTVQGLPANKPEFIVAQTLESMGISYIFQQPFLGGNLEKGGLISDFYLPEYALIISILGEYYHYEMNRIVQDKIQATAVHSMGINTIFIDEEQVLTDPRFYIEEALKGIDHSKLARM